MPTVCSVEEAVALVRPVDTHRLRARPGQPRRLPRPRSEPATTGRTCSLGGALCLNVYDVFTKPGVSLPLRLLRPGRAAAATPWATRSSSCPGGFRQMAPILARFAPRVMVAQAAPPDAGGRGQPLAARGCHPATSCCGPARTPTGCSSSRSTRTCPARQPAARSSTTPSRSTLIDVLVESDGDPFALAEPADRRGRRGHRRATPWRYVHDGSTLQTGIGAIPNMVAAELAGGPRAASASTPRCSPTA